MNVRYTVAGARRVTDPARQVIALVFCLGFALLPVVSNADPPAFASGLDGPVKLDVTQHGSLLVTDAVTATTTGSSPSSTDGVLFGRCSAACRPDSR